MDIEHGLSSRFRNMGIICAFLVVVIHCTSNFHVSNPFVKMFIYDGVCRIAVPFFFFASGFFLSSHFGENRWWRKEIAKRIRTLLVPYFVFVTLYFAFVQILDGWNLHGSLLKNLIFAYGLHPFCHPYLLPLWYIRALCVLVVLSPLLAVVLTRSRVSAVLALCVIFIGYLALGPWEGLDGRCAYFFRKTFAMQGLFYFSCGIFYRNWGGFAVGRKTAATLVAVGLAGMTLKVVLQSGGSGLYYYFGTLSCLVLLSGVFNLLPTRPFPSWLTSCAFPIYVTHMFFVFAFRVVGDRCGLIIGENLMLWCLMPPLVFASCVGVILLQRRFLPRLNAILWGGR